jgi:hypothetical protein
LARNEGRPHVNYAQGQCSVIFGEHQVLGLEVPVDNLFVVQVCEREQDLSHDLDSQSCFDV